MSVKFIGRHRVHRRVRPVAVVGPECVVQHGVAAPLRVFLLGPLAPIFKSVHEEPVFAHVRREDEVGDELFEPRQLRLVQVRRDANLRVVHELEHQPEVKVLEHRVGVLAKQRVLAVLEERVVESEVPGIVAEGADVQRQDLHVVEDIGEAHAQAVRRREHIRGVQRAVVRVLHRVQQLHPTQERLEPFVGYPEPGGHPGGLEDFPSNLPQPATAPFRGCEDVELPRAWGRTRQATGRRVIHRGRHVRRTP
mmetsp:Transcript_8955/g.40673  ORF Transcript_8955/g.40673 Transcript_8955/m.40673 type:complete len:251 (-) Transcript_8955:29-781(-)